MLWCANHSRIQLLCALAARAQHAMCCAGVRANPAHAGCYISSRICCYPLVSSARREERKKRYVEKGKADQRAAKKQRRGE